MMKILIALIALVSFNVNAALNVANFGNLSKSDAKIIIGTKSLHFDSNNHKYLNETNPSIGGEVWDIKAVYISRNSWNEKSLYLTYSPDFKVSNNLSLSFDIGLATGYKASNKMVTDSHIYYKGGAFNKYGVMPLYALTVDYSPLGNNFALSLSLNHEVAMFSVSYSL